MKGKAAILKLIPVKLHIFPRYRSFVASREEGRETL